MKRHPTLTFSSPNLFTHALRLRESKIRQSLISLTWLLFFFLFAKGLDDNTYIRDTRAKRGAQIKSRKRDETLNFFRFFLFFPPTFAVNIPGKYIRHPPDSAELSHPPSPPTPSSWERHAYLEDIATMTRL